MHASPIHLLIFLVILLAIVFALFSPIVFGCGQNDEKARASLVIRFFKWTGIVILFVCLALVLAFISSVQPGKSGILTRGVSPTGQEYCVVQTYKGLAEPYQVSFYVRDSAGLWRWNYLAHQDVAWRSATVDFSNGVACVSRDGLPLRDIPLPVDIVDLTQVLPGYRDGYCPSNFTVENVLEFHNNKFR